MSTQTRFLCKPSCSFASGGGGTGENQCTAVDRLRVALQRYFGFQEFRPGQLEALLPIVHGRDTFVRMATGAGKSLCMFLAPLSYGSTTVCIIISPLNGLMDQQVSTLAGMGVKAIRIGSSDKEEFDDVASGKYRFVLMSPECATTSYWRELFVTPYFRRHLVLVAVDEAHCISEWGADFRTSFERIGGLRALTKAPFLSLTASAPPDVECHIISSLQLRDPVLVKLGLNRPNIFYSVRTRSTIQRDLGCLNEAIKNNVPFPKTVIFCRTKKTACTIFQFLTAKCPQGTISMYHAKTQETKSKIALVFSSPSSPIRCLVATIAFGMGMDIPDIQLTLVYGPPDTLCQFYQLSGRSGRNGSQARTVLFCNKKDTPKCKDPHLLSFCTDKENCKRTILLNGLGNTETVSVSRCCDVCTRSKPPLDLITYRTTKEEKT